MTESASDFDAAQAWRDTLGDGDYLLACRSAAEYRRWKRYRGVWQNIFRLVRDDEIVRVLEVGAGGGAQLLPFALNGKECTGIDCSERMIENARAFTASLQKFSPQPLKIRFVLADWLSSDGDRGIDEAYDLVFNAGVIEHYLDQNKRIQFLRKKLRHLRRGGYLVSIVPNGIHPLRQLFREKGWGGYGIPEVDYGPLMLQEEAELSGAVPLAVLGNSPFGYLLGVPSGRLRRTAAIALVAAARLSRAGKLVPARHATSFSLIARKP